MRVFILVFLLFSVLINGCATPSEKERILEEGSFAEKISYIEKNYSDKEEVLEFFGPPDQTKDFYGYCSIWTYETNTQKPVEILFGRNGTLLRLDVKSRY